jgi:hypothetical protein
VDLWLPGYEHQPEHGAGLNVTDGAPKVVIHTTESGPGSLQRVRDSWRGPANWGKGLPHFIAEGDRYVQLLPLNVGAYTLENKGGGADTNRCGPAIQVEIVGYARNAFTDVEYSALGRWLADLVKAGVPLNLSQHPRFYGEGAGWILASYTARQRLTAQQYHGFNGFMGHQHCPENAHWDPGSLDGDRVERIALAHLTGGAPTNKETLMANGVKLPEITGNDVWMTTTDGVGRLRRIKLNYPDGTSAAMEAGDIAGIIELRGGAATDYYNERIEAGPIVNEWSNITIANGVKDAVAAGVQQVLTAIEADDDVVTPELPPTFATDVADAVVAKVGTAVEDAAARGVDRELDAQAD